MSAQILEGDVLAQLATLPNESVNCCVTSPPYWKLRDYGVSGQIGLEATPDLYAARMVEVFHEVRRVLKSAGTLWLNLGDSYAGSWGNQGRKEDRGAQRPINGPMIQNLQPYPEQESNTGKIPEGSGLKPKDLVGIPWRVAFALQSDGWYLRSDIIWSKPNPMPESVTDRPTKAHEYIFLLSKSERYFYDHEAIKEPASDTGRENGRDGRTEVAAARPPASNPRTLKRLDYSLTGRNKRTVWTVATQAFPGAHFATFPEDLITPCILAGCPIGGTVMDPFSGSGTTGVVALRHQRNYIGIELNESYCEMSRRRIESDAPLFNQPEGVREPTGGPQCDFLV